ncbi:MAG: Transglycosylase protein [Acidobacteriota bacterium]|nr:Transglycosylase protein [Acidobacteriota bacterium]
MFSQSPAAQPPQAQQEEQAQQVQRRNLFNNYRVLGYFLKLPDTLFIKLPDTLVNGIVPGIFTGTFTQADLLKIEDPFIAAVVKVKLAESLLKDKKYSQAGTLLMSLASQEPPPAFLEMKIRKLVLEILYFQQNYTRYIQQYNSANAAPVTDDLHTQLLYLNCLIKTNADQEAFEHFKKLFLKNQLKAFSELISPADLGRFLQKLSYGDWFQKFKYLAEKNFFSEFLREKQYVNAGQLLNLFYAEFYYKQKQYKKVEQYLNSVESPKLLPYKQKLLIKIELRRNNYEGILEKLEKLQVNKTLYAEVLLDAASILLIQHETNLSLTLFEKYIAFMEAREAEKSPGKTISDQNYWKALWTAAWLLHRGNRTEEAVSYFEKGLRADSDAFKIANTYWYHRLKKTDAPPQPSPMEEFPFTYYYAKIRAQQSEPQANDIGLKRFTALINGPQGAEFLQLLAQLKSLLSNGLIDESIDFVRWAKTQDKLTDSEKNTFKIIESILYLKKGDFFHTFVTFRNNFENYQGLRLPRFLSAIYCPTRYETLVDTYCKQYKLDKYLVLGLIREESFFRADAVSPARANGVMQLLYSTAKDVARKQGIRIKKWDLYNPNINIRLGTDYLKGLLDKYNNKLHLALAAYNAGDFRVDEWLQRFGNVPEDEFIEMIPFTDTRNYVKNILRNYFYYKFYYGKKGSGVRSQG